MTCNYPIKTANVAERGVIAVEEKAQENKNILVKMRKVPYNLHTPVHSTATGDVGGLKHIKGYYVNSAAHDHASAFLQ